MGFALPGSGTMGLPSEFMLNDVRCFAGEQRARLRPITLLVGENSTGKTTFLGCYSVLHRLFSFDPFVESEPDFNREPFSMGSFRTIARARPSRQRRIRNFGIGLTIGHSREEKTTPYSINVIFKELEAQPVISSLQYQHSDMTFLEILQNDNGTFRILSPVIEVEFDPFVSKLNYVLHYLTSLTRFPEKTELNQDPKLQSIAKHLSKFNATLIPNLPSIVAVAPVRSKPKRTYDPMRMDVSPEGDHMPMLMMRRSQTIETQKPPLHDTLSKFGNDSGMYTAVGVRKYGRQMNDPFQLQVTIRSGVPANILDVGYGVSQSLPILVDIHTSWNTLFLLQQPEVHLHPRAQAELATALAGSVGKNGNSFMIETHSDHIVDRIRILVRQKKLLAEDVSILYFQPSEGAVQIHNIEVDSDGNLRNVPPGYRDFFLRESDRLLGFED